MDVDKSIMGPGRGIAMEAGYGDPVWDHFLGTPSPMKSIKLHWNMREKKDFTRDFPGRMNNLTKDFQMKKKQLIPVYIQLTLKMF